MNKVILSGRLTADPDVRIYTSGNEPSKTARYTLAVERKMKGKEKEADFVRCVTFGKNAEFAEAHLHKGLRIIIEGSIRTGKYKNRSGVDVFTTDVIVASHEFAQNKNSGVSEDNLADDEFISLSMDEIEAYDEDGLPFK